ARTLAAVLVHVAAVFGILVAEPRGDLVAGAVPEVALVAAAAGIAVGIPFRMAGPAPRVVAPVFVVILAVIARILGIEALADHRIGAVKRADARIAAAPMPLPLVPQLLAGTFFPQAGIPPD